MPSDRVRAAIGAVVLVLVQSVYILELPYNFEEGISCYRIE